MKMKSSAKKIAALCLLLAASTLRHFHSAAVRATNLSTSTAGTCPRPCQCHEYVRGAYMP